MSRTLFWSVLLLSTSQVLAGCSSCNEGQFRDPDENPVDDPIGDPAPTNLGSWLSLDAAPDGTQLTLAFYDLDAGALGFAEGLPNEDGTVAWRHERVDGYPESSGLDPVNAGKFASHRVAADGTVWAAYQDVRNEQLRVTSRTAPSTWVEPANLEPGGQWVSLDLDEAGQPVVAHCDPEAGAVRLLRFADGAWSGETLHTSTAVSHTRVFADGGIVYVAFREEASEGAGKLMLATVDGADVSVAEIDADGDVGAWPSIGRDGAALVIAYHDVGRQDLRVAISTEDGRWRRSVIDEGELRGADTEVFSLGGELSIVYFDGRENDLMLARRIAGDWRSERIGTDGALGYHNEVAFTAGQWFVGSFDQGRRDLFLRVLE